MLFLSIDDTFSILIFHSILLLGNNIEFYPLDYGVTFDDYFHFNYLNQKPTIIIHIEDPTGNILLQQGAD